MKIISFGAGVQSSALLLLSDRGVIEKADYAIFSDVGAEPPDVYEWVDFIESRVSIPILRVSNGNLYEDIMSSKRFASIPFFTRSEQGEKGLMRRQCTYEYKINPVNKKIRELLGYRPRQRIKQIVDVMLGISSDEVYRVKQSNIKWIRRVYPLIDLWKSRDWCIKYVESELNRKPPRSSCFFCPFHSDHEWARIKKDYPDLWQKCIEIEKKINSLERFKSNAFLHSSLKPIEYFEIEESKQLDMFNNECEGVCGV